jgi:predicted phage baseplate assembly protein
LAGTLVLEIDEGDGFAPWMEVRDFFASGPADKHFVLNRTTGEVRFGSGDAGQIPTGNAQNPDANIVARIYRHGGGAAGNVAAGQIHTMPGVLNGIDTNGIANYRAALGGRDEESLAEGLLRGPEELVNKDRAVTAEDFESLTRRVPGVARARALPLANPGFPGRTVPGAVTVVVVPDSDAPAPVPSTGLLRSVCVYLQPRRILTCELFIAPPVYQLVRVRVDVIASADADSAEVRQAVDQQLQTYLHPLTGGEDGTGWEFGGPVYFSLVYRQVLNVAGVARIETLVIELDGVDQPACQDVQLEPGALAYSTEHDILVTYAGGAAS